MTDDRPISTTFAGQSFTLGGDVSPEAMRLLMGVDPASAEPEPEPVFAVQTVMHVPTIGAPPIKMRGLTGKRYRIARRGYARARRRWVREGSPTRVIATRTMYARHISSVRLPDGNVSLGFRAEARR